jgi:rod shape-determining protein MreB
MFPFNSSQNLAIDLGNNNTLITDQSSLLLSQPSCMVVNEANNKIEAVGDRAYDMQEKTHHHLKTIRPLKGGVISDGESAKRMLRELVHQASKPGLFKGRYNYLLSGIPFDTTSVEKRALRDALEQFPSQKTFLIHEPLAAALGMGLSIQSPEGKLIVDIGGGITEVVVISLSGIAAFQSTRIAGDHFDEVIRDHFRREYNMAIGLKTAEALKIKLGCVCPSMADLENTVAVTGKDLIEGIPARREISEVELCEVLESPIRKIEEAIHHTLEVCPPELASDIFQSGIYVTGGSAQLKGLQQRFVSNFQLPVTIDKHSLTSVSKGITQVLAAPQKFQTVLF